VIQFPKAEVDELQRELKEIQASFPETTSQEPRSLEAAYAEMLRQSADNVKAPPQKLVTDLLIRCLIWAELIQQQ
jgi:hypothetical protein